MAKINFTILTRSLTPLQLSLLTLWALLMLSFPFIDIGMGRQAMQTAVTLGTLAQGMAVILIMLEAWGANRTIWTAGAILCAGWAVEAVGSRTGFPFGPYHYTEHLQPQIAGVPILIAVGWLMMLPPSWAVGRVISDRLAPNWRFPMFVLVSASAMTAWDLLMDPMMVSWGMWVWEVPSGYFGIPWSNFLGWFVTSALITLLIRPRPLPAAPLLLVYTATWLLESGALILFWGLAGPGIVGGLIMGGLTILAWRSFSGNLHDLSYKPS